MNDTDEARQRFLPEFEHILRIGGGAGFSLGFWGGFGDYASYKIDARDRAGIEALERLDALIAELTNLRGRLAEAVPQDARPAAAQ
ncbi:hypothetical protein [Nocardia sp. NBC_01327]|uniref:hypothetical protein n=1 Tax=Nocardia sp. NBC_01327 TaxID=2903593 RepID=UPI002E119592|nr:hypothetical protein OG326_42280 [Nocardia sp. NBC_01327]